MALNLHVLLQRDPEILQYVSVYYAYYSLILGGAIAW